MLAISQAAYNVLKVNIHGGYMSGKRDLTNQSHHCQVPDSLPDHGLNNVIRYLNCSTQQKLS